MATSLFGGEAHFGQTNTPPREATNIVKIASGTWHNLAWRRDGKLFAWGLNNSNQCDVPAAATNIMDIGGSRDNSYIVRSNGTVLVWGHGEFNQTNVPASVTNAYFAGGGHFQLSILKNPQRPPPAPHLDAVGFQPDGSFRMVIQDCPGATLTGQASTNLLDWFDAATITATNGNAVWEDRGATNAQRRFY